MFLWLTIANVSIGTETRASTWSSTTRWFAPGTTAGAKTPAKATPVGPSWRKLRAGGPSSASSQPDILVQNGDSPGFTTGSPRPQIGSHIQSTPRLAVITKNQKSIFPLCMIDTFWANGSLKLRLLRETTFQKVRHMPFFNSYSRRLVQSLTLSRLYKILFSLGHEKASFIH